MVLALQPVADKQCSAVHFTGVIVNWFSVRNTNETRAADIGRGQIDGVLKCVVNRKSATAIAD